MKYVGIKGDVITDLNEDLAADAAITQMQQNAGNTIRIYKTRKENGKECTVFSKHSALYNVKSPRLALRSPWDFSIFYQYISDFQTIAKKVNSIV